MNLPHSEERSGLADSLARFLRERYDFETRKQIISSGGAYSPELWRQFGELGVIGALFSEAHGGFGGSGFDIAVVFEALGRSLVIEPFLSCALLAGGALAAAGGEVQIAPLPDIIGGIKTASFAHGEPDARYDLASVRTTAHRTAGGWVLNGAKSLVLHGGEADFLVVSARTAGEADDEEGLSLFLVPATTPGLALHGYPLVDGGRAAEAAFRSVNIASHALLGIEGSAFPLIERVVGKAVLALAAESLGAMEAAKEATLEHLRTRKQFNVPIGTFQALQHRMADLAMEIEQARSAVMNAAAVLEAERIPRERALSAAKFTVGRVGTLVAEECIQMHGGIGMTWELPLAHHAKRLVMIDHQLGDQDHHLERYIRLGRA